MMKSWDEKTFSDNVLQISELFYSIQGESTYAGYPCVFIRLAGCNLRCSYCDARYTYEEPARSLPLSELIAFTDQHPNALVQITGGEPLLQEALYPLLDKLVQAKRLILLETNGSQPLARVPDPVVKIMDIKCPGSGMSTHMHLDNLDLLQPSDEIKCVLSSRSDYDWAVDLLHSRMPALDDPAHIKKRPKILFSPVTGRLPAHHLAQWLLDDGLQIRLQIQLHTILWPEKTRAF